MKLESYRCWVIALVCLGLAACGGGGGGTMAPPTPTDPIGTGTYWTFLVAGDDDMGNQEISSSYGSLAYDASGTIAGSLDANTGGAQGTTPVAGFTWERVADGTYNWRFPLGGPGPLLSGGMEAAGTVGLFGSVQAVNPSIGILFRKGGTFDNASLSGAYHRVILRHDFGAPQNLGIVSLMTFDGNGAYADVPALVNSDGLMASGLNSAGTYTVAPDGSFAIDNLVQGALVEGGHFAVAGGGLNAMSAPELQFLLRATSGATNALFNGEYWFVAFLHSQAGPDYISRTGTVTAGGGVLVVTSTENTDSQIGSFGDTGGFNVAGNGTLEVALQSGEAYRGAISADGSVAILGGGSTAGTPPGVFFLVRK